MEFHPSRGVNLKLKSVLKLMSMVFLVLAQDKGTGREQSIRITNTGD